MSLRAAALVLGRRGNLGILQGIVHLHLRAVQVSGKKQNHPRNDIVLLWSKGTYIFTNPKSAICACVQYISMETCAAMFRIYLDSI